MQPKDLEALRTLETKLRTVDSEEGRDAALRAAAAWNGPTASQQQVEAWVRRSADHADVTLATWVAGDTVEDFGTVGLETAAAFDRPKTDAAVPTAVQENDPSNPLPRTFDQGTDEAERFDGRYRILRKLGEGGFGRVLLVEDTLHSGQLRALKTILPQRQASDQFELRFRNEIQVMRSMQHPGIPQIFNDGRTADGEFYFTMAFVNGRPFSEVMKQEGALAPERVARVLRDVVEVLCYAHDRGVIHRDLKPDNILLQDEGGPKEAVRVLDFGIAKILEKEGDLEGAVSMQTQAPIGTPHYMSPEQVAGRGVDGSTDIYALGILVYQFLSGKYPFKGTTYFELMSARLHEEPEPLSPKLEPAWARSLVPRLMARDPKQRPTAPELLAELDAIIARGSADGAQPKAGAAGRTKLVAGAIGVGALAALTFVATRGGDRTGPEPSQNGAAADQQFAGAATSEGREAVDGNDGASAGSSRTGSHRNGGSTIEGEDAASAASTDDTPAPARPWSGSDIRINDAALSEETSLLLGSVDANVSGTAAALAASGVPALTFSVAGGTPQSVDLGAGGTFGPTALALPEADGTYTLRAAASGDGADGDGVEPFEVTLTIDRTAPRIDGLSPESPQVVRGTSATIPLQVLDEHLAGLWVDGDAVPLTSDGSIDWKPALELGVPRTFQFVAADDAGNRTEQDVLLRAVPAEGPELTRFETASGAVEFDASSEDVALVGVANRPLASARCGEFLATVSGSSFELGCILDPGTNTLRVDFVDEFGLTGSAEIVVTRASLPPAPDGTVAVGTDRAADGMPKTIEHTASGLQFVYVAAGSAQRGGAVLRTDAPFYLCRTEVTRSAFRRYADERRLEVPPVPRGVEASDALPVTSLTRDEAAHFAEWAGASLPAVAQLRWAAVGPDALTFPWGATFDAARCNASGDADGFPKLAPADSFENGASWCGALNLCGNAWEWTLESDELFGGSHASKGESTSPLLTDRPFVPKQRADVGFRIVLSLP